jgi:hypothetical protein
MYSDSNQIRSLIRLLSWNSEAYSENYEVQAIDCEWLCKERLEKRNRRLNWTDEQIRTLTKRWRLWGEMATVRWWLSCDDCDVTRRQWSRERDVRGDTWKDDWWHSKVTITEVMTVTVMRPLWPTTARLPARWWLWLWWLWCDDCEATTARCLRGDDYDCDDCDDCEATTARCLRGDDYDCDDCDATTVRPRLLDACEVMTVMHGRMIGTDDWWHTDSKVATVRDDYRVMIVIWRQWCQRADVRGDDDWRHSEVTITVRWWLSWLVMIVIRRLWGHDCQRPARWWLWCAGLWW